MKQNYKSKIFLFIVLCHFYSNVESQTHTYIIPSIGLSNITSNAVPLDSEFLEPFRLSGNLSIGIRFPITDKFKASTKIGFGYLQGNAKAKSGFDKQLETNVNRLISHRIEKLLYSNLNFTVNRNIGFFDLGIGFFFNYIFNKKYLYRINSFDTSGNVISSTSRESIASWIEDDNWGITVNIMKELKKKTSIGFEFNIGLKDIRDTSSEQYNQSNQMLIILSFLISENNSFAQ